MIDYKIGKGSSEDGDNRERGNHNMKTFKFRFCYEISADANLGIDETEGGCE
jgi:hypothetical protein